MSSSSNVTRANLMIHSKGQTHQTYFNGEFSLIARCDLSLFVIAIALLFHTTFSLVYMLMAFAIHETFNFLTSICYCLLFFLVVDACTGFCLHKYTFLSVNINFSTVQGHPLYTDALLILSIPAGCYYQSTSCRH